jgi:hypothetical protein
MFTLDLHRKNMKEIFDPGLLRFARACPTKVHKKKQPQLLGSTIDSE